MFTVNVIHEVRWLPNEVEAKLDAIIDMLRSQSGVAADLALVKEELSVIHGIVANLDNSAELQKQVDELTSQLNTSTADVKDAIDQQTKET